MNKEAATARLFLFFIAFSIIAMILTPAFVGPGGPRVEISPRTWPYVSLGLLLIFSIGGFLINMRRHSLTLAQVLDNTFWIRNKKQVFVVAFVVVYILSMEYLGYIVSSFIALTSLFYIFGAKGHVLNVLLSAGFVLGTYFLFVEVFRISLPTFALI